MTPVNLRVADLSALQYNDYTKYPRVSGMIEQATGTLSVEPHPDGHMPPQAGNKPAEEHKAEQTNAPGSQPPAEPGRNVFQDKAHDMKDKVASIARKDDDGPAVAGAKKEETTKAADPAEHEENKAMKPPPPLPPNELKDMKTAEVKPTTEEEKQQQQQTTQQQQKAEPAKVVDGADAPKPADPPKDAAAAVAPEATLDEEEKVRQELFPQDAA